MNEKIKELAVQSGYGTRWTSTEQFEQFMETFAHLIYKDIISVVAAQALLGESAVDVFKNLKNIYESTHE